MRPVPLSPMKQVFSPKNDIFEVRSNVVVVCIMSNNMVYILFTFQVLFCCHPSKRVFTHFRLFRCRGVLNTLNETGKIGACTDCRKQVFKQHFVISEVRVDVTRLILVALNFTSSNQ